jgi:hypothetical protein
MTGSTVVYTLVEASAENLISIPAAVLADANADLTEQGCEKCVFVKERIPEGLKVQIINVEESAENLAEGAFYEVLDKGFPVLVVDDERVAEGAGPSVKILKELAAGQ